MSYLDDHPPARSQFREPRREAQSGVVGVHTGEGVWDLIGPDTGAENLARFIEGRLDPGSYHEPGDSDSFVSLVRDECEAYSVAADGHNRHTWNYSFAARSSDLHPESIWTVLAITLAGARIRAYWLRRGFCPTCSARWITPAKVAELRVRHEFCHDHALPAGGLVCHGTLQPADRSDAWSRHPHRVALEQMLVAAILNLSEEGPTVADLNELIAKIDAVTQGKVARDPRDGTIWFLEPVVGGWKHRLPTMEAVTLRCYAAKWIGDQPPTVFDAYSPANPPLEIDDTLADLTADDIAAAVLEHAARALAGSEG